MGKIKIQCEATTRTSIRLGKPRQCRAKGYFTPTTRRMLCRFHGCNKTINSKTRKYKGLYKNDNIAIDTKVKILKNLINFRDKTDVEIKEYITQEQERATKSTDTEQNTILDTTYAGGLSIDVARDLQINLRTFYKYLEQNPKFKSEYDKAQEIGIRTLVEKMLKIFDTDPSNIEPNELLFIREKKDWLKWLAPRISSLFQEKQKIDVKTDSNIKISWSSNDEDLIDVTEDIIDIPSITPDKS